jgi:hypothetical protein
MRAGGGIEFEEQWPCITTANTAQQYRPILDAQFLNVLA